MDVIAALVEVMAEARAQSGVSQAAVADAGNVGQRTVERWESQRSWPWKEDLPAAVAAYSSLTGKSEKAFWDEAVERASTALSAT